MRRAGTVAARTLPSPPSRTMFTAGAPAPGNGIMTGGDAARWQAAKQLRSERPEWLVIWVARTQRFHAYRLAASQAAPGLTGTEPAGLAAQIDHADRAAANRRARPRPARPAASAGPRSSS